ncbi:MAG: hypothetical protein RLZ12_553 [Bacillota bacterium]|jgi:hypothetical protein
MYYPLYTNSLDEGTVPAIRPQEATVPGFFDEAIRDQAIRWGQLQGQGGVGEHPAAASLPRFVQVEKDYQPALQIGQPFLNQSFEQSTPMMPQIGQPFSPLYFEQPVPTKVVEPIFDENVSMDTDTYVSPSTPMNLSPMDVDVEGRWGYNPLTGETFPINVIS